MKRDKKQMKLESLNLRLHMKIICRRFHIKTPFTFRDMRT